MRVFTKEEMGRVVPEIPLIFLSDDFMDKLDRRKFYARRYNLPLETDVQCPYCKEGVLVLNELKKDICEVHVCHTGDSYTFNCSNRKKCAGHFAYSITWMYC